MWNKVKGWTTKLFSSAGKEVLIKLVAQPVLVYSMSCFKLPRGLCEHLNKLIRQFWWGSKQGQRKPAWVSWKTMCKPKNMGGIGFRDIELFNLALLARQVWRLLQDPESLSARVLRARYYPHGSILHATIGAHPSQVWRSLLEGKEILAIGLIKRIGKGANTNIWTQNWLTREEMMRPYGSITPNPPTMVSELITSVTASGNKQLIQTTFMPMDA